jgi:two-component system LytT family response regulator
MRILFADDEQMARKRMRRLLESIPGIDIVAECESGEAAMRELDRIDVDVALLDIHMGTTSGLEVSQLADELGVDVIFTTAHEGHALEAFARGAIDYVLKPIEAGRLEQAIGRVKKRREAPRAAATAAPASLDRIALQVRGEVRLIRPADVTHAIHDGQLVTVSVAGEKLLTDKTLTELESMLPGLMRVHRRALLALSHVERLKPLDSGGYIAIVGASGDEVPVSRQAARGLRRALGIT